MGLDAKLTRKAVAVYKYYVKHVSQLTSANKIHLLVANKSAYRNMMSVEDLAQYGEGLIDVNDFVL